MKSGLSVGLFYNCQPVKIGLWFNSGREFIGNSLQLRRVGLRVKTQIACRAAWMACLDVLDKEKPCRKGAFFAIDELHIRLHSIRGAARL